jgi:hypothetical protein
VFGHLAQAALQISSGASRFGLQLIICCYYNDPTGTAEKVVDKENVGGQITAKLLVVSKEKQKFLEAHGLEQWWSRDAELQQ